MAKALDPDSYSDAEIELRREAAIKRMLRMPPKPHEDMKVGKKRNQRKKQSTKKNERE